jgi:hypothetical protein
MPATVAAQFKAWIYFARSKVGIVNSNPTQGTDVCVCVYSVWVAALRRADPLSKVSYRLCQKHYETEEEVQGSKKGCKTINEWMDEWQKKQYFSIAKKNRTSYLGKCHITAEHHLFHLHVRNKLFLIKFDTVTTKMAAR